VGKQYIYKEKTKRAVFLKITDNTITKIATSINTKGYANIKINIPL
jgi:hypothetical protein